MLLKYVHQKVTINEVKGKHAPTPWPTEVVSPFFGFPKLMGGDQKPAFEGSTQTGTTGD